VRSAEDHLSLWMVRERLQRGDNGSTGAGERVGVSDAGGYTPGGRGGNRLRQVEGGVRRVEATP
jgi:hypothetical protein